MRRARFFARGLLIAVAAFAAAIVLLALATARPRDPSLFPPPPDAPRVTIYVVGHGYHAGVVLPRDAIAAIASREGFTGLLSIATRFESYRFLEIGWGDENFYRHVPHVAWDTLPHAFRALFGFSNGSVLHVVGFDPVPERVFTASQIVAVDVGEEGLMRLLDRLDASVARARLGGAVFVGPGLYGPSLFVRAEGAFHIASVCNHWIARLLNAAGAPVAPVVATYPAGLLADLRWRAGGRDVR